MMEQLLAHLWGDYILQTHQMATEKEHSWFWAILHGVVYVVPFAVFIPTCSGLAAAVIAGTHIVIDRFRLGKRFKKFPVPTPDAVMIWLRIIIDNTIHLTINYLALRFL